ncbi:hypothetical protein BGZ94_006033 [Podila epigama]|nr:hypothetical protein BGZ94_006033 [Podila epigama]
MPTQLPLAPPLPIYLTTVEKSSLPFFTKNQTPNKAKIFFGHTTLLPHQVLQGLNTIEGLWTAVITKVGEATARFQTPEDLDRFIANDLFINGVRMRHTRCTSTNGRILTIRATMASFGTLEDTRKELHDLFAPHGTILHFDFYPLSISPPRYHPTIDFVLDIKDTGRELSLYLAKHGPSVLHLWVGYPH